MTQICLFYFQLDNLELHIRSHSTDRPFTCEHCDKSYKDAPSLYSHIQTHHSIAKRSHLCSECGASFMKSDHLKRHINSTHRKIKTIKCSFCDMMFSDKYKAKVSTIQIRVVGPSQEFSLNMNINGSMEFVFQKIQKYYIQRS